MNSNLLIDEDCDCPTCKAGWTRGKLRELWKGTAEDKRKYYELASMHNLRFIIRLTEDIRKAMLDGTFYEFRDQFLNDYYGDKPHTIVED
jgi:queuine tRNA-ribosyltransferase